MLTTKPPPAKFKASHYDRILKGVTSWSLQGPMARKGRGRGLKLVGERKFQRKFSWHNRSSFLHTWNIGKKSVSACVSVCVSACVCVCVSACVRGLACVGVRMYAYVSVCFFRLRTKKIAFFQTTIRNFLTSSIFKRTVGSQLECCLNRRRDGWCESPVRFFPVPPLLWLNQTVAIRTTENHPHYDDAAICQWDGPYLWRRKSNLSLEYCVSANSVCMKPVQPLASIF